MGLRNIQIMDCNICGLVAERDLLPRVQPPDGWLVLRLKSGKDSRERVDAALCPGCVTSISAAIPAPVPKVEPQNAE